MSIAVFSFAVLCGGMTWSFLEYFLHRFLGHDRRTMPNPFADEHTRHHSVGDYFAPTWKKAILTVVVFAAVTPLAALLVGTALGATYAAAFAAMYVAYEVVHRRAHTHEGIGAYGRYLRRHHFHHHFGNPRSNHGVTSPLWDVVFGTYESPERIRVPRKLTMRWLKDPSTGQVRAPFAGVYEIV